jgi:hypothetical protein
MATQISSGNLGATRSLDAKIPQGGASTPVTTPRQILAPTARTITDSDTLVSTDAFGTILANKGTALTLTVAPVASGGYAVDDVFYVRRIGAGQLTFVQGAGVTITSSLGALTDAGQNVLMVLIYKGADVWYLDNGSPVSLSSADVTSALGYSPSKRILLHRNNVTSAAVTGGTTETLVDSLLVPGGTFQANDIVNIVIRSNKTGTAGATSVRFRLHTSSALAGTVGGISTGGTTNLYNDMGRNIVFKNSVSSQTVYVISSSAQNDLAAVGAARSTLSVNFAIDQYIVISLQNGNAGDSSTIDSWYVEILRS